MVYRMTHWKIYQLFYDPPGTPKELKCVECKLAAGGGLVTVGLLGIYGAKRVASRSVFQVMAFAGVSLVSFSVAALTFRLAYDHSNYNKKLIADKKKETSAQRKQNLLKQQQQHQEHSQAQRQTA